MTMRASNATMMYSKTGQSDYQNNIFTAIPKQRILAEKEAMIDEN